MRTTIDIQDSLLSEVIKKTQARSKKKAVEIALKEYIRYSKKQDLIKMIGDYENFSLSNDDLTRMRNE